MIYSVENYTYVLAVGNKTMLARRLPVITEEVKLNKARHSLTE